MASFTSTISILAVLADRDPDGDALRLEGEISILAVLADRDPKRPAGQRLRPDISILAVLADRDLMRGDKTRWITRNFNPRGPCGPRQPVGAMPVPVKLISILAVLADRDDRRG